MDKKQYESPEMLVILIADEDVLTASGEIDSGTVSGDD